jgi:hypothetical protein
MPFVQFIPQEESSAIQASLSRKGSLMLSSEVLQKYGLDKATHVFLFFDPERRALGLRPAKPDQPGAVRLTRRKRGASVRIGKLLEFYRLVATGRLILEPERDEKEDLLVLPLLGVRMRPGRRPTKAAARPAARRAVSRRRQEQEAAAEAPAAPRRRGRPPKAEAESAKAAPRRGRPAAAKAPGRPSRPSPARKKR